MHPTPRFRWRLAEAVALEGPFLAAGACRGLGPRLLSVLHARGHRSEHDLRALFDGPEAGLNDARLLPDAAIVVDRVREAMRRRERVMVFGDFDADGLTGLAILVRTLRTLGLDAAPYVPHREREGHGLSLAAVERAQRERRSLIVTVDCGTSSVDEVAAAGRLGIDVIVTDHHRPPTRLPEARAIVNPHRAATAYPDARLAGSGVALKVAEVLLGELRGEPRAALPLAQLAAIGTVADVAPVTGENRSIVRVGLDQLASEPLPGLAALMTSARVGPSRITTDSIGFALAPRLNALGRVRGGDEAIALLLTDDPAEAERLAAELESANVSRQELLRAALDEARGVAAREPDAPITVISGPWPVGIVGLVAGRLADELGKPAVVFSTAIDPWRGSARSHGGFDVVGAFVRCADLFHRFGGHPAAAGGDITPDAFAALRERLFDAAAGHAREGPPELAVDLVVRAADVDHVLLRELAPLAATGEAPPLVGIGGLVVTRARAVNGGHVRLTMRKRIEVLDAVAFDREDLMATVREGMEVDVVARISSRAFGGFESIQLDLRDVAPAGTLGSAPWTSRPAPVGIGTRIAAGAS